MISFFWQTGFYFNKRLNLYADTFLYSIKFVGGLGDQFWKLFFFRCELMPQAVFPLKSSKPKVIVSNTNHFSLDLLSLTSRYVLNSLLVGFFPVLLNLTDQLKFNLFFFFFTRTYRGYALRSGKPLRRRTRARTYFRKNMKKPPKLYKQKTATSRWF